MVALALGVRMQPLVKLRRGDQRKNPQPQGSFQGEAVGILDQVGSILKQYEGTSGTVSGTSTETVHADFDNVASAVPTNTLADGG